MLNLLSNAVKFTAEGGRVDVEALVAQDGVLRSDQMVPAIRISVSDTGVGIKLRTNTEYSSSLNKWIRY